MLRDQIRKLVVVIRKLGREPVRLKKATPTEYAKAIRHQYAELRQEFGAEAVREAWKQVEITICAVGLAKAASPMPKIIPSNPKYVRKKTSVLKAMCDSNPDQAHLCRVCRMACGVPKTSWHSRELAEQSRARSKEDPAVIEVYECPHEPGNWHLGHIRKSAKQIRDGRKV